MPKINDYSTSHINYNKEYDRLVNNYLDLISSQYGYISSRDYLDAEIIAKSELNKRRLIPESAE